MYQTDAQVCLCAALLCISINITGSGCQVEKTECSVLLLLECVFLAKVIRAVIASVCVSVCVSFSLSRSLPDGG